MAKGTGKNAVLNFGGTAYACLTQIRINGTADIARIKCSTDGTGAAATHKEVGATDWNLTTTIVIEKAAAGVTLLNAFKPPVSGAVKAYMHDDEAGSIEYAWTTGFVQTHTSGSSTDTHAVLDVAVECDGDPTIAAKVA